MKLRNGSSRIRLTAALGAVAIAVIGAITAAGPAQAAEADHCAVSLPDKNMKCFDSYEGAAAFVTSVAEITEPKAPGSEELGTHPAATRSAALASLPQLLYVGFDSSFWMPLNGSLWLYGLGGNCTTPTSNVDYHLSTMPTGWDNRISSYLTFSNCWTQHWDLPFWGGAHIGYSGSRATMGALNNATSSLRLS